MLLYAQALYLEVEVVLGILIEGLSVGSSSDFCDLLFCSIAKSDRASLGSCEGEGRSGRQEDELKIKM